MKVERAQGAAAAGGDRDRPGRRADGQAEIGLGLTVRALTPQEKQQAQDRGTLVVEDVSGPAAAARAYSRATSSSGVNGKRGEQR